jgi:hypothetical protein
MFNNASNKLEDTRVLFDKLTQASDFVEFKSLFNSFLSSSRAVTYALQKQGKAIKGFREWYSLKQEEMKNDELLKFMHNSRIEDFHKGVHKFACSTYIKHLSTNELDKPGNASMIIGSEGAYWVVNEGTSKERKIPVKGAEYTISVSMRNAPTKHLNKELATNDPLTLCKLTIEYLEVLVYEAKTTLGR